LDPHFLAAALGLAATTNLLLPRYSHSFTIEVNWLEDSESIRKTRSSFPPRIVCIFQGDNIGYPACPCSFSSFFCGDQSNIFVRRQKVGLEKEVAWCTPIQHSVGRPLSSFCSHASRGQAHFPARKEQVRKLPPQGLKRVSPPGNKYIPC
jgi:hypothetical protein